MNKTPVVYWSLALFAMVAACGAPEARDGAWVTSGGTGGTGEAGASGQGGGTPTDDGGTAGSGGAQEVSGGASGQAGTTGTGGSSGTGGVTGTGGTGSNTNKAPQVSLSVQAPANIFVGTSVMLAAAATDDGLPAGASQTVAWSKVSGPGPVAFTAPAQMSTNVTFGMPGTYLIRAAVNDGALVGMAERSFVVASVATELRSSFGFNEGQGTSAADAVAGNPAATAANASIWTTGKTGSSINCTGLANTVSVPHSAGTALGAGDFTVTLWMRSTQTLGSDRYPQLLWKHGSSGRLEVFVYKPANAPDTAVFKLWQADAFNAVSGSIVMDGNWHHITARRKGRQISIAVDGAIKETRPLTLNVTVDSGALLVCGISDSWGKYLGAIDDVRFYGRALEDAEIRLLSDGAQ